MSTVLFIFKFVLITNNLGIRNARLFPHFLILSNRLTILGNKGIGLTLDPFVKKT